MPVSESVMTDQFCADVLNCLRQLQYQPLCGDQAGALTFMREAVDGGASSGNFRQLVRWLVCQLNACAGLEESISNDCDNDGGDICRQDFQLELSGVLRELQCVHVQQQDASCHASCSLLDNVDQRLLLLHYLCGEAQAARILVVTESSPAQTGHSLDPPAELLKHTLIALRVPKPPASVTIDQLLARLCERVTSTLGDPRPAVLWSHEPSDHQWQEVERARDLLHEEYCVRRRLLLTRLDVTMQSFRWSPRADQFHDQLAAVYVSRRAALHSQPSAELSSRRGLVQLMSAMEELAVEEKLCSTRLCRNTNTPLNKLVIGAVPDRGGRPSQQAPPPPEMPSWKPRQAPAPGGPRGAPGGRRGSGRVQGAGWNRQAQPQQRRRYN